MAILPCGAWDSRFRAPNDGHRVGTLARGAS